MDRESEIQKKQYLFRHFDTECWRVLNMSANSFYSVFEQHGVDMFTKFERFYDEEGYDIAWMNMAGEIAMLSFIYQERELEPGKAPLNWVEHVREIGLGIDVLGY